MDKRAAELICKVVDHRATPDEERELEQMKSRDPEIQEELESHEQVASTMRSVGLRELQDDVADQYWSGVYNRLENRTGWLLVIIGVGLVLAYGTYQLLTAPDIHTVYRLGIAAMIVGFGLVFCGVLRMRLKVRRQDPYKEIVR